MGIYIALLAFMVIYAAALSCTVADSKKRSQRFLKITFFIIFLIYSLRAYTVGRDLPGYFSAYVFAGMRTFSSLSFGNFEKGYLFFMWICNMLGFSFQIFLSICNFIILYPIYRFISKYSTNTFLSTIIYVCYIFFEFNMTGIRQALATSIVLIAIMVLLESKRTGLIKYCLIVLFATLFHRSAFVGFFYVPYHFMKQVKTYSLATFGTCALFLVCRGIFIRFIKDLFEKRSMDENASLYIGLNLIFLIILAVLFVIAGANREIRIQRLTDLAGIQKHNCRLMPEAVFEKMFYLSIAILFLLGSDTSVRSYMILNQVVIVLLPNSLDYAFERHSKKLAETVLTIFFLMFIFTNTLLPNSFDIVPYRFFWEIL